MATRYGSAPELSATAQAALAEAPTLIWKTDSHGKLIYVNQRFEAVFGRTQRAIIGLGWQSSIAPGALRRFRAAFHAALTRRHRFSAEVEVFDVSGALRWHRCEATPVLHPSGALLGYIGCNTDITDAKTVEAALRELNATLERRVEERTAQLAAEAAARAAAQDRLRHIQKLEALGQLAGGVAHDFNNASAAVLAGIALLEKRHGPTLAAGGAGALRLIAGLREGAERGVAISRRLLAFARREELHAAALDPGDLLRGLRAVLANALGPAIRVVIDMPAGLPALQADRAQLETTLINLAINARDAMPHGGTVTLGAAFDHIDANWPAGMARRSRASLEPGRYLRLWVADTGTGMDAATLARAAEPFFTTKPRNKGTGLGLSMADGFAVQSGGVMRIDSSPDHGTTVSLWLPQVPSAKALAPVAEVVLCPGRALVVEDHPMMRRFLVECLKHEGWEVQEAEDAGHALARLDAGEPYDLLVTDLAMPGMDGTALIQAARIKRPGLAALLLTGTGHVAEIARQAERNGFALLRKPVSPAELAETVAGLIAPPASPACIRS